MTKPKPHTSADALFNSYAQLTQNLREQVSGVCVLNPDLTARGSSGELLGAMGYTAWHRRYGE